MIICPTLCLRRPTCWPEQLQSTSLPRLISGGQTIQSWLIFRRPRPSESKKQKPRQTYASIIFNLQSRMLLLWMLAISKEISHQFTQSLESLMINQARSQCLLEEPASGLLTNCMRFMRGEIGWKCSLISKRWLARSWVSKFYKKRKEWLKKLIERPCCLLKS